jgi:YVTN family beta-propeller protein
MLRKIQLAFLAVFVILVCATPVLSQTPFTKTYQLGGNIGVSCCTGAMTYGFTPVIQDHSLSGNVQITSVSFSDTGNISATDPNHTAGTTWEIFIGTTSCGFPAGQQQGSISLSTYTCSSPTQLVANTNGNFVAPTSGVFAASYNFQTAAFTANDTGQLISASTVPFTLNNGLFLQVLLWGGDVGASLQLNNITVTVTGTAGSVTNLGDIQTIAGGDPQNVSPTSIGIGVSNAVAKDSLGNFYIGVQTVTGVSGGLVFKIDTSGNLTTVAGNYTSGIELGGLTSGDGGLAINATLSAVSGLAVDSQQNLYIADFQSNTIRKVTASTGVITTFAGGGGGCTNQANTLGDNCPATSASLSGPYQLFLDANQNLFIADSGNNRIREVVASTGLIKTVAGGGAGCTGSSSPIGDGCSATAATLNGPIGVFLNSQNNIFISDSANNRIREVSATTGIIQTIAGNGTGGYNGDNMLATAAEVNAPRGLFVDSSQNVFFADSLNERVREIVSATGFIQTLAGGGTGGCTGSTDTFGDGCPATQAIVFPYAVFLDASENIFIADSSAFRVREVSASNGIIHSFAGNGTVGFGGDGQPAVQAQLLLPFDLALDPSNNVVIADSENTSVRKISATGIISTIAGGPLSQVANACPNETDSVGDGCLATQVLVFPISIAFDHSGNLFISDLETARIRKVSVSTGIITTVAGGGTGCANQTDDVGDGCPAIDATLTEPWGLYVDDSGNIFFADYGNSRIREVVASTGLIQTIAGTGTSGYSGDNGPAVQAQITNPTGLSADALGNIYFSDTDNFRIREIVASTKNIVTIAGTGTPGYNGDGIPATSAEIDFPYGIFSDRSGNIFFGDQANGRVREIVASTGLIQSVAGNGTVGFFGDGGPANNAELAFPEGVATDPNGNLFIADTFNNRVREVFGVVPGNTFAVTTTSLPPGNVGTPYSFGLQATGGTTPYNWSLASGTLPPGFSAVTSAGVLSGTPTTAGTFNFTVKATDNSSDVQTQALSLTINPAVVTLVSISVTPVTPSIAVTGAQQFTATGHYSDGSTQNLTTTAIWSSSSTGVATISSSGLATGVGGGTTTITATSGNIFGNTTLTVTATTGPTLVSIAITPVAPTLVKNAVLPFIAIGTFSDGSTQNLTGSVIWSSATSTVATISAGGVATGVAAGTSTITAVLGNTFESTVLTVTSTHPLAYVGTGTSVNCCLDVLDTTTNALVTTIPVTGLGEPFGITPDQSRIYLADISNNVVDVVNTATNTLIGTIAVGHGPNAVAITPDGRFGYVANSTDTTVSVFSVATNALVAAVQTGISAGNVTVTPDGNFVYVSGVGNTLAVINTKTNTVSSTFTVAVPSGQESACCLFGPVLNQAGTLGYIVQNFNATTPGTVSVISIPGNTVVATITVGEFPGDITISPDGTRLYVANLKSNSVSVINTSTNAVIATVPVSGAPQSVAVSPDSTLLYVAMPAANSLSIVNTATNAVTSTLTLTTPFGIIIPSPPSPSQATTLTLAPPNLIFNSQPLGSSSPTQTISLTNPGPSAVSLTSVALTGPNVSDFSLTNNCPQPPATLGVNLSCPVLTSFKPTATGTRTALVTVSSSNGTVSSQQSAPLSGTGISLVSIAVTPANPTIISGGTQQFTATGTYNDGSMQNLTGSVTWTSSTTFVTINSTGLASGLAAGSATITATLGNISGNTTLTVTTAPVLVPLTVSMIGTGNGTVTDNLEQINCVTTAGVQSGTCSASYASGTIVNLTATPSGTSTFAGWGNPCTGTGGCAVTTTSAQTVTASFVPPPQMINLSFTPGTNVPGMATYDCPSNPSPSPGNPCTDPNAHAAAVMIPQVLQPFSLTVEASEVPPSTADGVCPNGGTPSTDFDCRFVSFFTYQTLANGNKIVPLCVPYANGNCVHYQVFSGTPGVEPDPTFYVGPINWTVSYNSDTFVPPAPYTGSTPRLYDDPDYAVSPTSPFGSNCSTAMLVGNPPVATKPPIFCQFEFDITTAFDPTKKVDTAISGRTKQFNDVVVAFPPANVGNLTVTTVPASGSVTAGSPLSFTISISDSAGGAVTGATLTDPLPSGTNVSWSISPSYTGPGTCAITGAAGSQVLNCAFGTITASQAFTISLLSASSSVGTYTSTAVVQIGNQQVLSIGTITAQAVPATFTGLTASESIQAGTTSITLAGTIGNGASHPAPGETISVELDGVTSHTTIGSGGTFTLTFPTAAIPASSSPYLITYSFAGDSIFSTASNSLTSVTVLGSPTTFPLTVTLIGTGNGTVTDNLQQIDCTTTAGVQSGSCSANYPSGTVVSLTATPSSPSTFAGWGGACSGTQACSVAITAAETVTASFAPAPQLITLSFAPGSNQSGMATYDCPSNPAPSPTNPCTDPNAHALALAIPQVLQPFSITVQASEVAPSVADGDCPSGATPSTDFDCRFVSFFTYQTLANGNKIVPLCFPYANGNCVHYQVFSGTPGVEPNPSSYVGPIDWTISFNNDTFVPPAPYTGSTPQMYDDPDYAVSPTSPFGTNCSTPMLVGNPPVATNPQIFCQFEFDITTAVNLTKKVDTAISGRTKQFNDVAIAFPPANTGNLAITTTPSPISGIVTTGSALNLTIAVSNSAGGPVTGATLSDPLPAGTNVSWSISPAYTGPGTCAITGAVGSQVLSCAFGTIAASQNFSISLLSSNSSLGKYTSTAVVAIGNQQILTIGAIIVTIPGDVNGDGVVNCADISIVKASFGKSIGQVGYDPRADINHDGVVNVLDLATVARQLPTGTTCN